MRIGIDLDGVVIDSETTFRVYEELYDLIDLKGNNLVNREEPKFKTRYNWTREQQKDFTDKYFLSVSRSSHLMPGFVEAYKYLKNQGHEFVVITARGLTPDDDFMEDMEADAKRILNEGNIVFNKYYWKQTDKLATCKKENIDYLKSLKECENNYYYVSSHLKNYFNEEISILIVNNNYRGKKIGKKLLLDH